MMLDHHAIREAVRVRAREGRLPARGRVPEHAAAIGTGERAAGRDRVVLRGLFLDGEGEVWEDAVQLRQALFETLSTMPVAFVVEEMLDDELVYHGVVSCPPGRFVQAAGFPAGARRPVPAFPGHRLRLPFPGPPEP